MYLSPLILCNNILYRGFRDGVPITPMKLQKLMYFVCRDYLKRTNQELITENFAVWQYGPVLQTVYDEFKSFRARKITTYAKDADCNSHMVDEEEAPILSEIIDNVWAKYKHKSGIELSNITHQNNSGWYKAFQRGDLMINKEDMFNDQSA